MLDLDIQTFISRVITLLIAFTVHELAHAIAADRLGDPTPRQEGRLTLNPIKHLDPLGSLLLVATGFGWAKPVRINTLALTMRNRYGPAIVSFAGPFSNFLLALASGLLIRFGGLEWRTSIASFLPTGLEFLTEFLYINIILMIFNLLPIPPLDGEKILYYFLSPEWQQNYARIRPYGTSILLLLILLPNISGGSINPLSWIIQPVLDFFVNVIILG